MARGDVERTVEPAVLDRLIDTDPATTAERAMSRAESVQRLKDAVRRDLEWLLNTRRIAEPAPPELEQVTASLYHYGLPDISSMSRDSSETRGRLAHLVEEAIATFEPRLSGVKVALVTNETNRFGELRFVIEGLLRMDPSPERISFDTLLQTSSGQVKLGGEGNA